MKCFPFFFNTSVQVEKKIKFSNTDMPSAFERSPRAGRRKMKSKSSTLSLHALAREEEEEEEPLLQRRNSIHNVSSPIDSPSVSLTVSGALC